MNNVLYDGFHRIEEVKLKRNGKTVIREKLILKDAVAGIVTDEHNQIAIVTQYRPNLQVKTKEIPAGVLDKPQLTPTETLIKELEEECHIKQSDILSISDKPVYHYYMIGGNSDAKIQLYDVKVKSQGFVKKNINDDNDVELVEWITLNELQQLVDSHVIDDPKTIIAFHYLLRKALERKHHIKQTICDNYSTLERLSNT